MNLSHPITSNANKLASLFNGAEGVTTKFYFYAHVLKIYCADAERAQALVNIVKPRIKLGKLFLDIEVYKLSGKTKSGKPRYVQVRPFVGARSVVDRSKDYAKAFENNPFFYDVMRAKDPHGFYWYFVLMMPCACQYLNDDLQNPWSTTSILPQDIIKKMFYHKSIQISTMPGNRIKWCSK